MDRLPAEILVDILDYIDAEELVSVQRTCSALSHVAYSNPLWRYKCFEKSPSASMRQTSSILNTLTNALEGLTLSERPAQPRHSAASSHGSERVAESARARAVNRWDLSAEGEIVDWYSEYKGRYAPLSADWLSDEATAHTEVKGVSLLPGTELVVGYLEDHSVCVWDLARASTRRRKFRELGRSKLQTSTLPVGPRHTGDNLVVDCVSSFASQQKAYVAVGSVVEEIDLNTLTVLSHSSYPYPITALSQPGPLDLPLTVGTQWSLHVLDPRVPVHHSSTSSEGRTEEISAQPGRLTAMLPDIVGKSSLLLTDIPGDSSVLPAIFRRSSPFSSNPLPSAQLSSSPSWLPPQSLRNPSWNSFAKVEPGPLNILHQAENEILICGRFPSILSYDRRFFPRLQYVIHSSASLSAMTSIPHPPAGSSSNVTGLSTLVACGEYRGRGSLELYSLPHVKLDQQLHPPTCDTPSEDEDVDIGKSRSRISTSPSDAGLFSYKNRQDAAKSKILSVAAQGMRIVFSDSEGGLKWVERDGHSLARRWNINAFEIGNANAMATSAFTTGDLVARKIIPLAEPDSERGARGDGDLLIWTGEKIGIVTTNPQYMNHEDMVNEMEGNSDEKKEKEEQERREEEYSKTMRQALERQADERRWMSQFRLKTRHW
ncbi:hypothetical protein CLCR_06821 [Cladophialophora carrionii]|uniref:F-box domain-containing protein n=1 Tax=Cladophialophora carrionii TaxID=86049 RepID=A0A1C1CNR8_9EURO|nr:hypothetical protein CLCR_06821 [Cladophialophora carrionii]